MTRAQIVFVAAAFATLIAITVAVQFRWLKDGAVKTALVLIAGISITLSLRLAELPPSWFEGSKTGFGLGLGMTAGAFLGKSAEEKSFRFPLFLGMGGTLLAANVVAFLEKVT